MTQKRGPVAAMLLAASAGQSSVTISPLLVGSIGQAFDSELFGAAAVALEIGGMAVAAAFLVVMGRLERLRPLFLGAIVLILIGNGLSMLATTPPVMLVARLLAGLGEGAVMAALGSAATRTPGSAALFAMFFVSGAATGAVLTQVLPPLSEGLGVPGLFIAQAVLAAVALAVLLPTRSLPDFRPASPNEKAESDTGPGAVRVLLGVGALYAGNVALWTFLERIAVSHDWSMEAGGRLIGMAAVVGIVSGGLASKGLDRIPLLRVLMLALPTMAILSLTATNAGTDVAFASAVLGHNALLLWVAPAHLALLAIIDPSGRAGALAIVPITIGSFIGVASSMALTPTWGYGVIGVVGAVFFVVAVGLSVPVAMGVGGNPADNIE